MITMLKKTREKNTFQQDTKTRDEGAGHTTDRGSKLSVPLRKIHKYYLLNFVHFLLLPCNTCHPTSKKTESQVVLKIMFLKVVESACLSS